MNLPLCYSVKDAEEQRAKVWSLFKESPILERMKDTKWTDEHHGVRLTTVVEVPGLPPVNWQMTVGLQIILPEFVSDKEEVQVEEATRPADKDSIDGVCVGGPTVKSMFEARVDVPLDLEFTIMMHRERIVPPRRDQQPTLHMMTSGTVPCVNTQDPEDLVKEWLSPGLHWGTMVDPLDGQTPRKTVKPKTTPTLILP